jgi:hypothetical protein
LIAAINVERTQRPSAGLVRRAIPIPAADKRARDSQTSRCDGRIGLGYYARADANG